MSFICYGQVAAVKYVTMLTCFFLQVLHDPNADTGNVTLIINAVRLEDSGEYFCVDVKGFEATSASFFGEAPSLIGRGHTLLNAHVCLNLLS